ncbi:hypothetical protein B0E38_06488 [Streptomyces sp. 111WW2]|nr:hypothetical protein [Streptomyces sp. 111WW2]PSK48011.1 hypothetical protein B0E38_06488 [Streptomyces sp. 111WW2]
MGDTPADPITKLATAAVSLHELYTSLIAAGFTEAQAMEIVKAALVGRSR